MLKRLALPLLLILCVAPVAADAARLRSDSPAIAECINRAAQNFQIPELPLWVILDVEGGTLGKVSQNTNKTYDIGPMQINSIWLKHLAPFGITEHALKNNLCVNIYVAAWIFTKELQRHGTLSKALAYYHSPTPKYQHRYLGRIQKAIDKRVSQLQRESGLASNG